MQPNERKLILVLAIVQFCHIIDFMIIMPLGNTLMIALDISPFQFNGMVAVYAGAAFVSGLVGAAFIDRFDRKQALIFLFAGFTVGTIACGLAPNYHMLLVFRALTGFFGGILSALVLAVIGDVFPLERRASAMGWVMTAFSAASVVGIPSGIALAAMGSWRTPFYVIGALSVIVWFLMPYFVPSLRGHLSKTGAASPADLKQPASIGYSHPDLLDEPDLGKKPDRSIDGLTEKSVTESAKNSSEGINSLGGVIDGLTEKSVRPSIWEPYLAIINSPNQRAALLFTLSLMFGHFTIIPNLATYMELNVGFTVGQVSYIYLLGGLLTVFILPFVGKMADRHGRFPIYMIASIVAIFSIFSVTNLPAVSIPVALIATSSFFVVSAGRSVPATTMITSVVEPSHRGSFMTIRQSVNEAGLFFCSIISGLIIYEGEDGRLMNYEYVGYFTILMSIIAVYLASRIKSIA